MKNQEVANLLKDIADLLELKGDLVFKINAYRKAAQNIENMTRPIEDVWKSNDLKKLPGVGKGIAEHIEEYLAKGHSDYYEKMKKKMPMDFESLRSIEGLGPKKIKVLYEKLKVKNVGDLKSAAKRGKIRVLPGFGEKTEHNILKSIEFFTKSGKRVLLGHALPMAEEVVNYMKKNRSIMRATYAGSLRRMRETIGDIDILVTAKNSSVAIDHFVKMPGVSKIMAKGSTKASIIFGDMQIDLRVLKDREYGSALLYFTGSKDHNVGLRKVAIAKGMKLSEYGLFRGTKLVASRTEEEIYKALGLRYIEPEMRKDRGEIDIAKKSLPELISYSGILGDLQMHTKWSDCMNTIKEMAAVAKTLGYEYICITDHLGRLKIANAMSEKDVDRQKKEIEKVQDAAGIKILHGAEIDIRADGGFDVSDGCLKKFDIVFAALHSSLKGTVEKNTERIAKAMENPNVDVIAHMSGRLIGKREGADLDIQKIAKKAIETNTVMEINAQPNRLDLSDINSKAVVENGCELLINTDAHSADQLNFMKFGIAVARRAWCTKKDILNTLPYKKFSKEFDISV